MHRTELLTFPGPSAFSFVSYFVSVLACEVCVRLSVFHLEIGILYVNCLFFFGSS